MSGVKKYRTHTLYTTLFISCSQPLYYTTHAVHSHSWAVVIIEAGQTWRAAQATGDVTRRALPTRIYVAQQQKMFFGKVISFSSHIDNFS